jgi:GNAT superfamily N-acetyltransferase
VPSERSQVALRSGRTEDAQQVAEIWREGWREGHLGLVPDELARMRTDESFGVRAAARVGDTTVAELDGEIAGFVMVAGDEVEQVYVAAAHRGTGVARELIAEAERQVAAGGFSSAWLAVVPGNRRARAFYERAGWTDEGPFEYQAATEHGSIAVRCHRYTKAVGS